MPLRILSLGCWLILGAAYSEGPRRSFTDITLEAGTGGPTRATGGHGVMFADVDGDGLPDLYITMIFDKEALNTPEFEAMKKAAKQVLLARWGEKPPMKLSKLFRDGMEKEDLPGYGEGVIFVKATSKEQPELIDRAGVSVVVGLFPWFHDCFLPYRRSPCFIVAKYWGALVSNTRISVLGSSGSESQK